MNLKPTALAINANMPYKGYDVNGLFHPVEPIQEFIPLKFYNVKRKIDNEFILNINYKLKLVSFSIDAISNEIHSDINNQATETTIFLKSYNVTDNRLMKDIRLPIADSRNKHIALTQSNIIIDPDLKYSLVIFPYNAHSVTFFCKAVSLLPSIDIYFPNTPSSEESS